MMGNCGQRNAHVHRKQEFLQSLLQKRPNSLWSPAVPVPLLGVGQGTLGVLGTQLSPHRQATQLSRGSGEASRGWEPLAGAPRGPALPGLEFQPADALSHAEPLREQAGFRQKKVKKRPRTVRVW